MTYFQQLGVTDDDLSAATGRSNQALSLEKEDEGAQEGVLGTISQFSTIGGEFLGKVSDFGDNVSDILGKFEDLKSQVEAAKLGISKVVGLDTDDTQSDVLIPQKLPARTYDPIPIEKMRRTGDIRKVTRKLRLRMEDFDADTQNNVKAAIRNDPEFVENPVSLGDWMNSLGVTENHIQYAEASPYTGYASKISQDTNPLEGEDSVRTITRSYGELGNTGLQDNMLDFDPEDELTGVRNGISAAMPTFNTTIKQVLPSLGFDGDVASAGEGIAGALSGEFTADAVLADTPLAPLAGLLAIGTGIATGLTSLVDLIKGESDKPTPIPVNSISEPQVP